MTDVRLTARELQLLHRLMRGMGNKAIADDLGLSDATVKTHLKSARKKTGTANRTALAMWGVDHGFYSKPIG